MKPLVSILIPAFNAEQWIGETIRSATAQSWPRKEIIIVDDGSTDRTLAVAQRFASTQVAVVSQPNRGAAAARNAALAISQGEYIQWLDADDLLACDKVAAQMRVAEQEASSRVLLSAAWAHFIYRPGRARFSPTALSCDLLPVEWMLRKWEHNLHMQTATWLVSRELTAAAGPWNSHLLGDDDGEYFCRVILGSAAIRHVPEARVFYRSAHSGSLSYIGRSRCKQDAHWLSMQLQLRYLRSVCEDDDRLRAAAIAYLQTWLPQFFGDRPDLVREMELVAATLGGRLEPPQLSWKYAPIGRICGWNAATDCQLRYNRHKLFLLSWIDKIAYYVERAAGRSKSWTH